VRTSRSGVENRNVDQRSSTLTEVIMWTTIFKGGARREG
jgi:hypothetical protein